jgi:hypothetical protein
MRLLSFLFGRSKRLLTDLLSSSFWIILTDFRIQPSEAISTKAHNPPRLGSKEPKNRLKPNPLTVSQKKCAPHHIQGEHYNLRDIFDKLNAEYFSNQLQAEITWFGSARRKARRHRKLGLYDFRYKRIKIHRLLDQSHFPHYFISYVVYHEMLHSVCPPIKAKKGRYQIHHNAFKEKEQAFADYAIAKQWERANTHIFFK